ncbi:MAG: pantoate--beta-alanine ligase [Deltaproteobacteria bacterium]|nr:MAG: pantoate--beta-alanine ligase [Deltaproteobacteria bacterium]
MQTLTSFESMQAWANATHREGLRIGFVPTMGFLHAGHVSLMERLRPEVDRLVVSIYVNPLQFGPDEDLERYPRDPEGDAAKCDGAGVDVLFMPPDLYPDGFVTSVAVDRLTDGMCGATRPGHFDGVTTVVARLFNLVRADVACFGEKDFQQLAVIRRMVRDLAMPVEIVGGPLVRDPDGLAMSSRNKYLTETDRERGLSLHRALFAMRDAATAGEKRAEALLAIGRDTLTVDKLHYLELVDAESLQRIERVERPARALVAAFLGKTRLIDNVGIV